MTTEHYGILLQARDTGHESVMLRGHQVGPFDTLAEAERSAKKKNRIAKTKGVPFVFSAVPVDVNPWGQPIAKVPHANEGSEGR